MSLRASIISAVWIAVAATQGFPAWVVLCGPAVGFVFAARDVGVEREREQAPEPEAREWYDEPFEDDRPIFYV